MQDNDTATIVASSPEVWLQYYLTDAGIFYDYKTDGLRNENGSLDPRVAAATMRIAATKTKNAQVKSLLNDVLVIWKAKQARTVLDRIREQIGYTAASSDSLDKWVTACIGQNSELDLAVMWHFIWQVKRKLFGLPVEHHMMPVLYGRSGGGKSVAVRSLLAPLETIALTTNMTVFQDRFGLRQFIRNYVMFFDELEGSGQVDVNRLKQVITSPVMEWRVMHSEGVASAPQNCTFIGCSNDPLSERIKDPTSARRFWQVNCADRICWETINAIDYVDLWRSVDEAGACPIIPYIDAVREIQERSIRAKDLMEQWLEDECEPYPFYTESPTTSILYDYFRSWCQWQGLVSYPTFQAFSKGIGMRIRLLGWQVESKHASGGTVWSLRTK